MGILEREPIRAQINALAQNDRAELRKQGVRFGAYYLFVPALIKPAPRNLALQLWGLQARGDANDLLRTLGPVASSGRTSLAWDNTISKDGYRVAGYRPCGERVVRVDVVERLAGMVRAAIASEAPVAAPGLPNHRTAKGFVVSGEMTSLTGCSGDQFASILRSMGFKPVEMRRSDFFAPAQADGSPGESESAAPDEGQDQIGDDRPSSPATGAEETTPDAILASPPAEPPVDGLAVDMAPAPVSADPSEGPLSVDVAESSGPQTPGSSCEPAKNTDMIVVWRPDRRRISPDRQRERKQSKSETPGPLDTDGRGSDRAPKPARYAVARPAGRPNRPDPAKTDEKRRQRTSERDMPRSNATTAPQHKAKVDPNSPFAKLLELRPLLEEQANKRP